MRRSSFAQFASLSAVVALAACATGNPPTPPAIPSAAPVPQSLPEPAPTAAKRPAEPKQRLGDLTVTVMGVLPQKSWLQVGLFDQARYHVKPPPFRRDGPAEAPTTVVTFTGLKPGRYAVKILQDLNGNRDMDSTLLGVPEEPFGLSNDIKPVVSEPGFDETSFEVKPGANAIVIHMQQM